MKKLLCLGAVLLVSAFVAADVTHFTETLPPATSAGATPVSNGYDWSLSNGSNAPAMATKGLTNTGTLTQTGAITQSGGNVSLTGNVSQTGGTVTQSSTTFTGGAALWQITAAQELTLTASTTGQLVWCSNCTKGNLSLGMVCVSTGSTTANQFVAVSSFTAVQNCQ